MKSDKETILLIRKLIDFKIPIVLLYIPHFYYRDFIDKYNAGYIKRLENENKKRIELLENENISKNIQIDEQSKTIDEQSQKIAILENEITQLKELINKYIPKFNECSNTK